MTSEDKDHTLQQKLKKLKKNHSRALHRVFVYLILYFILFLHIVDIVYINIIL